ncbi:MAG: SCO family protein [Rhizobiaceae bacterium]
MKTVRIVAWLLVACVSGFLAYSWLGGSTEIRKMAGATVGGPFEMARTDGTPFGDKQIVGKPHLIFFGFTHCPEVCPTTLFEASGWLEKLGADADRVAIYFVSVDPERDTADVLDEYVKAFDPRITALTGSVEQVEVIKKAYKVFARKVPLDDGDYTIDHTATVYLMHGDGTFSGTIAWGEDAETALAKIRRLIENG